MRPLLLAPLVACVPTVADLGPDRPLAPCEEVTLPGGGDPGESWTVSGLPVLLLEADGADRSFVAPARNRPTRLSITRTVGDASDSVTFDLAAAPTPAGATPGTMPACGDFVEGVASGDPDAESVLLWTRMDAAHAGERVAWVVARDPLLSDVVAEGEATVDGERDGAVAVEVSGLPPGTSFWYRFLAADGRSSELGHTRTLPEGPTEQARLLVTSCSSLWSGYWNAYARMAMRDDMDLVLHVGDFLYDFVDEDEEIRLPATYPQDPTDRAGWRARFHDYLADPDLRLLRAAHPMAVLWDNHDSDAEPDEAGEDTMAIYRDYVPMRRPDPGDPSVVARDFELGDLATIHMVDVTSHRETDPPSLLGTAQWATLEQALAADSALWRVLATQKLLTPFRSPVGDFVGEASPWDEFPDERTRLWELLGDRVDNVVLSGDLHFTVAADLVLDPDGYDPLSPVGSLGVEFLPASTSRGNFDEAICGGDCDDDELALLANVRESLLELNPHDAFLELTEHGYGLVELRPDGVTAEVWYTPILWIDETERLGASLEAPMGQGRWRR